MSRLRGLIALVVTVGLLVGVPWALLRYGHWPIHGLPSLDGLRDVRDDVVSDTMVFGVLTVAAWLVWAGFAISVTVETIAVVRGIEAPRFGFLSPLQRPARVLVAAIVLAVTVGQSQQSAAVASAPRAPPPSLARAPDAHVVDIGLVSPAATPNTDGVPPRSTGPQPAPADVGHVVTVRRGDSAWALAEQHLGDGMRWRELWELNRDRPQPDGRSWTDPQLILPGWQLELPPTTGAEPTTDVDPTVHVVVRDDTLSDIARERLGDPSRFMEIFEHNRGRTQPDGRALTDPDLILPGWQLRLPSPPLPQPAPPLQTVDQPEQVPTSASASEPLLPSQDDESPRRSSAEPPVTVPRTAPRPPSVDQTEPRAPRRTAAAPPTTTVSPAERRAAPAAERHDDAWLSPSATMLAGVSGAVVFATGLLLRLRRSRHRRFLRGAGASGIQPSEVERAVVAAADVPLVRWAGQALAELVATIRPEDLAGAPQAVELSTESGIELLWDTPNPSAPPPWTAADGGWAWLLPYDPDAAVPLDELPAAIPALVTIGQREGRQLMVDLEAFGTVSVTGDEQRVDDFLRAATAELATGDDLSDAYVVAVDIEAPMNGERVLSADLAEATARVAAIRTSVDAALDSAGSSNSFAHRCGPDGAHLEATVVVVAGEATAGSSALVDAVTPRRGAAAIVANAESRDGGAQIHIEENGTARIEPLGVVFTAASLPIETATAVASLVEDADDADHHEVVSNGHSGHPISVEQLQQFDGGELQSDGDTPRLFELDDTGAGAGGELCPLDASLVVKVLGTPRVKRPGSRDCSGYWVTGSEAGVV